MRLLRRRGLLAFALLPLASFGECFAFPPFFPFPLFLVPKLTSSRVSFCPFIAAPTTEPANFASATLLALQIVLGGSSPATETIHAARVGGAALSEVVPPVCQRSCSDYLSFEPVSFIIFLSSIPDGQERGEGMERKEGELAKLTEEGHDWVCFRASLACS